MRWKKYRLKTLTSAEDIVIASLAEAGVEGAQIEDNVPLSESDLQQMFVDIPLAEGPDDGIAYIDFYLDEDADAQALLDAVRQELDGLRRFTEIGECSIEESVTEDKDWVNNWKQYFHKFKVDDILIIPSWEDVEPEQEASMVLRIDPGIAFGTGKHESTQLAIRGLRKYLKDGMRVLDIGTGSGILGIIALKSGASYVLGTDLDVNTLEAIAENIEKNEVDPESFAYVIGNIQDDPAIQEYAGGDYDIVVANIIAEILAGITPVVPNHLKKGGIYITSGILITHAQVVRDAMAAAGLTIIEENEMGEWESIVARLD